jgi:dolichyl-phosphate-mannose-protein mannosyltransferase
MKQEFFMDVHPPLGKLLLALGGYLGGYSGDFSFSKIGLSYLSKQVPYMSMRTVPALMGVFLIPLTFVTLLNFKASRSAATLSCLLLILDNALTCQSRLIMLDSILIFFVASSVFCWSQFRKYAKKPFSLLWWNWLLFLGISF